MLNKEFLFAGKATFTIQNQTGTHYTYRIMRSKDGNVFFANQMTGTDNESHYSYMGLASPDGRLIPTQKSKVSSESTGFKVLSWFLRLVAHGMNLPNGYLARHSGNCGRCNRKLTNPISLDIGIGPECVKAV